MHRDTVFTYAFIFSLTAALFFLGNSITGNVTQSMHCTSEGCAPVCRSSYECPTGLTCCSNSGLGVCREYCTTELISELESNPPITAVPKLDRPGSFDKPRDLQTELFFYGSIVSVILLLGFFYYIYTHNE